VGEAPHWVVRVAFAVWIAGLGMLAWVLRKLVVSLQETQVVSRQSSVVSKG
jgi:hypothetical protein